MNNMDISFQIALQKVNEVIGGIGGSAGIRQNSEKEDVYEFGVYEGQSVSWMKSVFSDWNYTPKNVFGFDSFGGFPEDSLDVISKNMWREGNMKPGRRFKNKSPKEVSNILESSIKSKSFNLNLIAGFFSNTLVDELVTVKKMNPAIFVNIDCDQYSSTYDALDFMFRNNLIVTDTIIRYDDWNGGLIYDGDDTFVARSPFTPKCWTEGESGQSRAHKEILEKYGFFCTKIYQDSPRFNWKGKTVFIVEGKEEL